MTEEYAVLREGFLTFYYLITSVCRGYLDKETEEKIFGELREVFCLPKTDEINRLYTASCAEVYRGISDLSSYERLCRMMEYAEKTGQDMGILPLDRLILAQLRTAVHKKAAILSQEKNTTLETILTSLQCSASNGNIDAMLLTAFMEYHGICVSRDPERALRRMRLCARWNNLCGNLFCLSYDAARGKEYLSVLSAILKGASQKQVYDVICRRHGEGEEVEKNATAALLEKVFSMGMQKRERYDRAFARVAFSDVIATEDKEKLLLGHGQEGASLEALPLDLRYGTITLDAAPWQSAPLKRTGESEKIMQNITVAVRCSGEVYKPLLLLCNDDYVTDMYADLLKKTLCGATVAEIDASTLSERDFAKDTDNIFVRTLAATKRADTFFFLRNADALTETGAEEAARMFDPDYRRRFKLFHPSVSLDLSGIRFVLFASGRSALGRHFRQVCDTVSPENVNEKEKEVAVKHAFRVFREKFGLPELDMENGACLSYLSAMDSRQMLQTLDGAMRRAVYSGSAILTLALLQQAGTEATASGKGGFGYAGGNEHA